MKKLILAAAFLLFAAPLFGQAATHSVTLTWTPVAVPATTTYGYNVYRSTASGAETIISPTTTPNGVTCTATLCTYVDQGSTTNVLAEGTTYFYYVRTVDLTSHAMSAPSTEVSGLIPITIVIPPSPNPITIVIK